MGPQRSHLDAVLVYKKGYASGVSFTGGCWNMEYGRR